MAHKIHPLQLLVRQYRITMCQVYSVVKSAMGTSIKMMTLTVTNRGQVTLRKSVLQHLGIKPGDKIELDLLPGGQGLLKAAQSNGTLDGFIGLLAGRTDKVASLEDINAATAQAWAGNDEDHS